jgi:beta-barrel assembly-enhancing protease
MKKVITQGAVIVFLFFGTWFVLMQFDWVNIFKVQEVTSKTEEKLGELIWEIFEKSGDENKSPFVINSIDSIVTKVCKANGIDRAKLKIHILNKDEVNAFALPDGYLVIFSGLIENADNQEEVSGVICHEIGHIELNHVMKKLIKEIGLSVLISMTTGNSGSEILKETARVLSSSAFDRSLEREADIKAVDYMVNAEIDPEPFANFLYKLATEENELPEYAKWVSTHPDSRERAEYVIEYSTSMGNSTDYKPVLSNDTWSKLQDEFKGGF